jgi:hypothetical protein
VPPPPLVQILPLCYKQSPWEQQQVQMQYKVEVPVRANRLMLRNSANSMMAEMTEMTLRATVLNIEVVKTRWIARGPVNVI